MPGDKAIEFGNYLVTGLEDGGAFASMNFKVSIGSYQMSPRLKRSKQAAKLTAAQFAACECVADSTYVAT